MSRERTFTTTLIWHDSRGGECEAEAKVTYAFHRDFAGDLTDPPEPDSVEILGIIDSYGDHVPDSFLDDEDLKAECFQDWLDDQAAAEEYRAEQRRDDLMMERF